MDSLPVSAIWSTPAGAFMLAPVLSFSLAVAAVTIIGLLMEAGVPAAVALAAAGVSSRKQARLQVVDIVSTITLTKMAHQIVSPATIASSVREAFRVAQQDRPGPVHLELPEDIAAERAPETSPVPPHPIALPVANAAALDRAI